MKKRLLSVVTALCMSFGVFATVHNVSVTSNVFTPSSLTITQGDTVIWTNNGGSHNVNGTQSTFPGNPVSFGNSVGAGWTYQFIFNTSGTYDYQCDPHAGLGMVGTVTVNPAPTPCAKPFFSEYIEGSSNNKGFEVYNPTGSNLDLGPFKVMLSVNGGSVVNSFNLSGSLASGDVYIVTTDQADPTMLAEADTALSFPSVAHFNGDDALFLVDTVNGDTLDIIGVVGVDPGSSWTVGSGSTQNNTLVRDTTVDAGETDWSIASTQWSVEPSNTFSFFGSHGSNCTTFNPPAAPCSQPFFSEYIEGSSNNKGFEVYNPSGSNLDLGPYKVMLSVNGGSVVNSFNLSGNLASGDVYVISTDQADPAMLAVADTALSFPSVAHFNGDDALFLLDTVSGDTLDIIGVVGVDPGSSWTVGSGSTSNNTLTRDGTVQSGETDWTVAVSGWTVNPNNTFNLLGSHASTCFGPLNSTVSFDSGSDVVVESVGSITVTLSINPVSSTQDTITLQAIPGANVTVPGDGTITPTPDAVTGEFELVIPAGEDSTGFVISIVDDAMLEGNETLAVNLVSASPNLVLGASTNYEIIVQDNDQVIPTYDIVDVTGLDANFEPDSLTVYCKLRGTVFTPNFDGGGISIYIKDGTDGINVFNFNSVPGYTPTIGDSIRVIGEIDFYNGLTEIIADSIVLISSGNTLQQPTQVTELNESTESELIRLNGYYMADPSQWPATAGNDANIDITNGRDTLVMRIDRHTEIDGTPAPTGYFDVIGVGGQFDGNAPYDEGYQIFPRDTNDIIEITIPDLGITEVMPSSSLSAPVNGDWFEVTNNSSAAINIQGFSWDDDARAIGNHEITSSISIPAGETALFVDVATGDVSAWEAEWMQAGNGLLILNEGNQFSNGFSDLNSGGDEVNFYDADGRLVSFAAYTAADVSSGVSLVFDADTLVGSSVSGTNGAYTSSNGDVGSPGNTPPISLNEFKAGALTVYPNPANSQVVIESGSIKTKVVNIRSINGASLKSLSTSDENIKVDISDLAKGVYIISLDVDGQVLTQKLIVE